ncbi:MAG TPA: hypothetical protein VF810_04865 [Patescibacteria group bacterium]
MTNFANPKPYISEKKTPIAITQKVDKRDAIKQAIKIIRENKRLVEAAEKSQHENPHR